ncbi:MAG: HlyD family efflux transporter periplasmic adaptor subunit [Cyanobacteriota bacterium]|nr:HlyD family efflux transporter periplasmic adaptor subunit [Cyanobacteriota bacterium]
MELQAKKGYQTGIKWLAFSSLITAVGFGGYFAYNYYQQQPEEPLEVRLVTLEKGTIRIGIDETGSVKLGNQQVIKTPDEGAVERVFVAVGDSIFAGEELIRLRNPERESKIEEYQLQTRINELELESKQRDIANAEIAVAEKKIAVAEIKEKIEEIRAKLNEPRKEKELRSQDFKIRRHELDLEEHRRAVINAELELEEAKEKMEIQKKVFDLGLIAGDRVLDQEKELRQTRGQLRTAEKTLEASILLLEEYKLEYQDIQRQIQEEIEGIEEEIEQIQSELRDAESQLREAESQLQTAKEELMKNNIELEKEEIAYQKFLQEIEDSTIISPINGRVLNIKVKAGDGLGRGDDLLTVGNPNIELVALALSTLSAAKVERNQLALVTVIGPETEPLRGRVENISLQAGDSSDNNRSSGVAKVGATVRLDNPAGLIPGTTVNVKIIFEQAEDVPVLEIDLVGKEGDRDFVWVQGPEGKARQKTVTLGLDDGIEVEITSGLNLGDKAIVPPLEEKLEPGRAIAIIESEEPED